MTNSRWRFAPPLAALAAVIGIGAGANSYFATTSTSSKVQISPISQVAPDPLPEDGCLDRTTLKIVRSIRQQPQRWRGDDYRMERGTGFFDGEYLGLWTANEAYGLDLIFDEGGNSGMDYPFTPHCRVLLHKTVVQWKLWDVDRRIE
jgi:hypothetical protein